MLIMQIVMPIMLMLCSFYDYCYAYYGHSLRIIIIHILCLLLFVLCLVLCVLCTYYAYYDHIMFIMVMLCT